MASEYYRPGTISPMLSIRARRISDEEWDKYREKLVKLYIEEEASQKDIINIMANEHNFVITEKQLKHRLQKWNVRKHISSSDMGVILSLKRKQDALAKDIKIQYQGYVLHNDRLERASKRRKDHITTPPLIPSHIKLCRSQLRSPLPTQLAAFAGYSNVNNTFVVSDSNRENPYSNRVIDAASSIIDCLLDFPLDLEAPDGQASSLMPEVPMSQSFGLAMNPERTDATPAWTTFESMLLDGGTGQGSATDPAKNGGILGDNEDSATVSHSRFPSSLEVPPSPPKQPALCSASRDLSTLSSGHTLATSTMSNNTLPYVVNDGQSTSLAPLGITDSLERFSFHGTDLESIIPQLQLMRSQLFMCLDGRYRESHLTGSEFSRIQLAREITSDWLLSEVDDMLCWSYDVSARLIRQQRAGAGDRRGGNQNFLLVKYSDEGRISESDVEDVWLGRPAPQLRGKLTSLLEASGCTTRGKFQLQLREASKKPTGSHDHQSPYSVIISFVPEVRDPTIGISVAFSRLPGAYQPPRMCPTITTFNVIPKDSEIITCIKQNDLKGVQRLLDEHKASTLDVDPGGFSLLHYAMFSGCSEVYCLLLQGGASTQRCNAFSNMSDLIDSIWMHFLEFVGFEMRFLGFSMKYITDINQCIAMTNVALKHGCDAGGHYLGNLRIPTVLFEFSMATWIGNDVPSFSALLEHLLAAGYEMEDRNDIGQTPLLFAANVCQRRSLASLNQLVSLRANVHATDNEGHGALHQALDFCRGLMVGYMDVFMKGQLPRVSQAMSKWTDEYCYDSDAPLVDPDNVTVHQFDAKGIDSVFYGPADHGDDDHYCYIGDYDIDDFNLGNGIEDIEAALPSSRQKTRVRLKLLTLLEAGCDPNLLDKEGASPSDYARREDLLPQWEWALVQTGYMYDEDKQLWIRNISFSDIVDMTAAE